MFIDKRHKAHDNQPICAWCHQKHKTYIMVIQSKGESPESLDGGLTTFSARDCDKGGIL